LLLTFFSNSSYSISYFPSLLPLSLLLHLPILHLFILLSLQCPD
jgi:hypothetical protein